MRRHSEFCSYLAIVSALFIFQFDAVAWSARPTTQNPNYPGNHEVPIESLSPQKKLAESVKLARAGEIEEAFDLVRDTKNLQAAERMFQVSYLNTLLQISESSSDEMKVAILNEAIQTTNLLKSQSIYDGTTDPELAYHFMVTVGNLANAILPIHQESAEQMKICQGSIARRLNTNPAYPANAKLSLSPSLVAVAEAHTLRGEPELAMEALTEACQLGFCEFEKIESSEIFSELKEHAEFSDHVEQLHVAYVAKAKEWSRQAIDEFSRFPMRFSVNRIKGGTVSNRNFQDKIVVVDFWATWCPPCRKGIPHFVKLQEELGDQGVQVIGISMDSPDDPESSLQTVLNFANKNNFNYPCGMGTDSLANQVPGELKLPTTLFIDRMGNVRYIATGYLDYEKLKALAETLAEENHVSTPMNQ